MLSRADLERLVKEAAPALVGAEVRRAWRSGDDGWVLVLERAATVPAERLALEIGLAAESARLCALPLELAAPSDKDDSHFFATALRKNLAGKKLDALTLGPGHRIA